MNIALVKLSALGDVVHALPVAVALRAHDPAARLVWVVERRESAILAGHPALDEVVIADTRAWRRARRPGQLAEVARAIGAVRARLRALRIDVAIDLQGLVKSGILTAATGAPLRIGFAVRHLREPLNALFTNRRVAPPPAARHVVERCLALLSPLGVSPGPARFEIPVDAVTEAAADEFFTAVGLKPGQSLVVLNPGAGRADKRWPAERFQVLVARLVDEAAAAVLVVWGPGERKMAESIAAAARVGSAVLAPPTDLARLVAVLRRASVVVGGDTGPLHVAAALGRPCVGLYGPTRAERNGPYGEGHRHLQSPDGRVASIQPGAVLHAVLDLLDGRGSRP
jgi:lipopolysaccharide heptosyltransferase I